MVATYNDLKKKPFKSSYRKSQMVMAMLILDYDKRVVIAEARFYCPASTYYCCLWVKDGNDTSGTGMAQGWGYDKPSTALAYAIENAGIELNEVVSGVGMSAMESAMRAIGRLITGRSTTLITTYA